MGKRIQPKKEVAFEASLCVYGNETLEYANMYYNSKAKMPYIVIPSKDNSHKVYLILIYARTMMSVSGKAKVSLSGVIYPTRYDG